MNVVEMEQKLLQYGADIPGIKGRFMGDMNLYVTCMGQFMEDSSVNKIGLSVEQGDYREAFEAAHTLKGMSGNMGLTPFYRVVCELVEALRANQYEEVPEKYGRLLEENEKVKNLMKTD